MDAGRVSEYQRQLEQRRRELKEVIVARQRLIEEQLRPSESGEPALDFNHPADMISGDPDYERDLRLVGRERAELTLVEQALWRLKEGQFGTCESCGRGIGEERLKAVPYTKYCVSCQQKYETALH